MDKFGDVNLDFVSLDKGICNRCRHRIAGGLTCMAFPDGIPDEILRGEVNHRKPYKGDGGIQFVAVPEI